MDSSQGETDVIDSAAEEDHRMAVAAVLAAQIKGVGGYDDDSDPELLPTVVFRAGWPR